MYGTILSARVTLKDLKAAYIERFTRFIQWPDTLGTDDFTIAIYDDIEFKNFLKIFFSDIKIDNKSVNIVNFDIKESTYPQILYIGSNNDKEVRGILDTIKNKPVLVIGDNVEIENYHLHLSFIILDKKLRFIIDREAFDQSNLEVGYQLLQVAVESKEND